MNNVESGVAGWIYQQDYITFLAILGWVTAGLIAWGNAAAKDDTRTVPWRWFALAAIFFAFDGMLDLLEMVSPDLWPLEFESVFRLFGFGCLLELARRNAMRRRWAIISWVVPILVPTLAIGTIFFDHSLASSINIGLAFASGSVAGVGILASVGAGTRPLLAPGTALLLLGPLEVLRMRSGVEIDRLYGMVVTGEGFVAALCALALAWVAGAGLWLHSFLRERRGETATEIRLLIVSSPVLMPLLVAVTLAVGYMVVNERSTQARIAVEREYKVRARTAALAIDRNLLELGERIGDTAQNAGVERVRQQLMVLRAVGGDVQRLYIWSVADGRIRLPRVWLIGGTAAGDEPAILRLGATEFPSSGDFLSKPLGSRAGTVLMASAPLVPYGDAGPAGWLGMDISAAKWFGAQAAARVQAIVLTGLFASVVVFFFAHQMLREYESGLRVAKESAEAGDRAKEEFLAVMSHEIRTPMQSVLGYSELLAHSDLGIAQREYLDAIRSQGRTLLRIVQDILDFSILRKSSYTLKRETVFLPRLVESAFETIQPLAARKDLRTSLSIAEDVPEVVLGDAVRIEQILLNLLGNAVKFTDQGAIRASVEVDKRGSNPDRTVEWVVFTIADSGMGIRKDEIRRLFEPFARAPDAESKPREGAGLGLAIVKRLCQLMGGRVEIESEYGKGTRFFVRLPFVTVTGPVDATAFAEQGMSAASREAGMGRLGTVVPLRFLVADDNPYIRLLMIEYLHSIGYDPVAVDSGGQAAARWREFDFLILDLRMPGMDGVTAAQKIREESKNAVVPWIVGVSATLAEAEIERAMRAGMNDFLGKPFFVQSLVEAIEASPIYVERLGRHEVDADADDSEAGRGVHVVTPSPGGADPADPQGGVEIVAVAGEAPEAAETKIVPEPAGAVPMSWMPDLTANGTSDIVEQAVAEIPGLLDEIGSALQKRQFEVASDRAHYLKNTILALRIDVMNGPGRELNERAAAGDAPLAIEHLDTLRQNFAAWMVERETKQTRRPRPD